MNLDPLAYFYFVRPVHRLADHWPVKSILVVGATAFWAAVESLFGIYSNLLSMSPYLLGLASIAFFGDFASAVLATLRDEGWAGIELIRFRQLLIKAAYWIVIIFVFSAVSSAAKQTEITILQATFGRVDVAAVFWLTIQDLWSILANWRGKEGAKEWFQGMIGLSQGELSIDDLTTKNSQDDS